MAEIPLGRPHFFKCGRDRINLTTVTHYEILEDRINELIVKFYFENRDTKTVTCEANAISKLEQLYGI